MIPPSKKEQSPIHFKLRTGADRVVAIFTLNHCISENKALDAFRYVGTSLVSNARKCPVNALSDLG